jgi:hypothetical protein
VGRCRKARSRSQDASRQHHTQMEDRDGEEDSIDLSRVCWYLQEDVTPNATGRPDSCWAPCQPSSAQRGRYTYPEESQECEKEMPLPWNTTRLALESTESPIRARRREANCIFRRSSEQSTSTSPPASRWQKRPIEAHSVTTEFNWSCPQTGLYLTCTRADLGTRSPLFIADFVMSLPCADWGRRKCTYVLVFLLSSDAMCMTYLQMAVLLSG